MTNKALPKKSHFLSRFPFLQRCVTSLLIAVVVGVALWAGGEFLAMLVVGLAVIAWMEWEQFIGHRPNMSDIQLMMIYRWRGPAILLLLLSAWLHDVPWVQQSFFSLSAGIVLITFVAYALGAFKRSPADRAGLDCLFGGAYFLLCSSSAFMIAAFQARSDLATPTVPTGLWLVMILVAVAATDSFAYLVGSRVGGPKLCPAISPKKTWSGLLGGWFFTALYWGAIWDGVFGGTVGGVDVIQAEAMFQPFPLQSWLMLGLAVLTTPIAQAGDLMMSWFKRQAGLKDSGMLFPGHGGVLDRIDGMLLVLPLTTTALLGLYAYGYGYYG